MRSFRNTTRGQGTDAVGEDGLVRSELIASTLGYRPERLVEIDDGYDYEVVVVDDAWVFRFPRRPPVEEALAIEIELLPRLREALPVEVPRFEYVSRDPLFVAYPIIEGSPLVDEDAAGVRAFLDALHAFDATGLPVERPDWIATYRRKCAEFERLVVPLLNPEPAGLARTLFGEVETLTGFVPALIHADLGAEHLRVRGGRLTGVIDWGDTRIGDPALDYAWPLNGPFPDWDVDDDLRRRARIYHRLAPWYGAHYGLFTNQPAFVERGLAEISSRL
jgi:aminoglycoside phosphotransferase (APT) family kinase protein